MKIVSFWLDLSLDQIGDFLEKRGIPTRNAPYIWHEEFVYCVVGQQGKVKSHEDNGIHYGERVFLRKACHALGLVYEDLGILSEGEYEDQDLRLCALHVPKGWTFNPERHVAHVEVCVICNDLIERDAFESYRIAICRQCYKELSFRNKLHFGFKAHHLEREIDERELGSEEIDRRRGFPWF